MSRFYRTSEDLGAAHSWAVGDIAEAAHDITVGLFQSKVLVPEGARLVVCGPSGNGLYPIAVHREDDEHLTLDVSASNLRRPNGQVEAQRSGNKGNNSVRTQYRKYRVIFSETVIVEMEGDEHFDDDIVERGIETAGDFPNTIITEIHGTDMRKSPNDQT